MIEVRIPKEINDFREKLFLNLDLRQTICSALAISINVPLYIFGKEYIDSDILSWVVIFIAIPVFIAGFFKYNSMYFEDFLKVVIKYNFLDSQIRVYKTENMHEILIRNSEKTTSR